ncbi:YoaK family protein [Enterovirga rhinocerotis]|uniref:Uncharacterized membrane protein YoaK (UPF0700 family) n=1 Tax=Enterovirga rhinocerotis TaxID=1339210 RepID=A0A4R7C778_9HYPH|nr:YoaK family protein [Enterovirga rhinocerotis]TDR93822.1 uncharacterized membrane protein YoaK (UPF0700 family) [Enterovirga rhinocerotis]
MNGWRFGLGLLLTGAAGAVDAISFTRLGAVYASLMSGNTIQVGIHAALRDIGPFLGFLTLIGLFLLGSFVGAILLAKLGPWHLPAILTLEAAALGIAVALDTVYRLPLASIAPLSFAMGAQNHLVVLARGANAGTTFVTGTLFRFADALAQRAMGRDRDGAWRLHLSVWSAFVAGATLGTLLQVFLADYALVPVFVTVGVAAAASTAHLARRFVSEPGRGRAATKP